MIKAILFDFDGVLTRDATGTISMMKALSKIPGIDHEEFEKAYRRHNYDLLYGHTTHQAVWQEICQDIGADIDIEILNKLYEATPMDWEMIELAIQLQSKGYSIGMITDNKGDRVRYILDCFDLNTLFQTVIISSDIGSGKKDHPIFQQAVEKLELTWEECLFIDNNADNLVIPNMRGMYTIYFDHQKRDMVDLRATLDSLLQAAR